MGWDLVYLILLAVFTIILSLIFGFKLQSAGNQLGSSSLKQAGNIVIFMVFFFLFIYSLPFMLTLLKHIWIDVTSN
jgi:hypothetical protein